MAIPLRRRTESENIVVVFSILIQNFVRLMCVSLLFTLPSIILHLVMPFDVIAWIFFDESRAPQNPIQGLSGLVLLILLPLLIGSVLRIVTGCYARERVSIAGSIALAARKFFALAIYGVLLFAMILACWYVGTALNALFAKTGAWGVLVMMPALYVASLLMSMFFVGMPAIVVEDLGVIEGMRRSMRLTQGHKFGIFGFLLLLCLVSVAILTGMSSLLDLFGPALLTSMENGNLGVEIFSSIFTWLLIMSISLLYLIAPGVAYFQLRFVKEDYHVNTVADLVDRIHGDRGPCDSESRGG